MTKPWLYLPAQVTYNIGHPLLKIWAKVRKQQTFNWQQFDWRGLHFNNPLGTSGGIDKNAELIEAWWSFGAGFVEIGTVTPRPQKPNSGKILGRNVGHLALWNKMGFPNDGALSVKARLDKIRRPYPTPLFINIGKNRDTDNLHASEDYLYCIRELKSYADVFVVNISSPNTADLRQLLKPENLQILLRPIAEECRNAKPLILKLSPDMSISAFKEALDISYELGISGWIISNTTLNRAEGLNFPKEGGVSGLPVADRAKAFLKLAVEHLGERRFDRLLISSGGILTPQDVFERLHIGAQLVQVYTGLVFNGPLFFSHVAQEVK
ncbi:MAG: dihydroorotate dehydrogenase (quinone) [Bdellovibrionales bacterium RBG_16_40_8]|nr:MAG: dihydroorotate dehydrogenase (quinone) [Bdellovibrionales bacterium RBG_16_40_8]